MVGFERIKEVLETDRQVRNLPGARRAPILKGRIEFDHVYFGYGDDRQILSDVSLKIEPGQVAGRRFHWEALVGDNVVVRITVNWLMGEENLVPPWSFGPAGERYEIEVRGNPDAFITVKGWQPESVEAGRSRVR